MKLHKTGLSMGLAGMLAAGALVTPAVAADDDTLPVSEADSPRFSSGIRFQVRYDASDGIDGSGLSKVALYVKTPLDADFVASVKHVDSGDKIDGLFRYEPTAGDGVYAFYTVATDLVGNVEAAPAAADTETVRDTSGPRIQRRMGELPYVFNLRHQKRLELRMHVSEQAYTAFVVRRDGQVVKRLRNGLTGRGLVTRFWFGRDKDGRLVDGGRYVLVMRAKDRAGNLATVRTRLRVLR